jgi:hypothetical protein
MKYQENDDIVWHGWGIDCWNENMSPAQHAHLIGLGYGLDAVAALEAVIPGKLSLDGVRHLIEHHRYRFADDVTGHRALSDALTDGGLSCLEAALLSCDLVGMLGYSCCIMVMTRVDRSAQHALGHTALIYEGAPGAFGAMAKSRHPTQGMRACNFASPEEVVLSYASAYLVLGFRPVSFGLVDPGTLDCVGWRADCGEFGRLHDLLVSRQDRGFEIACTGVSPCRV